MHRKQTTSHKRSPAPRAGSWARGDDRTTLEERLLTADEVARILHVSRSFVYLIVRRGDLPCFQIGSVVRFRPKDVRRYLAQHGRRIRVRA